MTRILAGFLLCLIIAAVILSCAYDVLGGEWRGNQYFDDEVFERYRYKTSWGWKYGYRPTKRATNNWEINSRNKTYVTPLAEQGNTVFGYGQQQPSVSALLASTPYDRNVGLQQQYDLASLQQTLAGESRRDHAVAVRVSSAEQTSTDIGIAQIAANQSAAAIIREARLPERDKPITFQLYRDESGQFQASVVSGEPLVGQAAPDSVIGRRCLACHSGDSPKGDFSLEGYESWGLAKRIVVLKAVTIGIRDGEGPVMPLDEAGESVKLSAEEVAGVAAYVGAGK